MNALLPAGFLLAGSLLGGMSLSAHADSKSSVHTIVIEAMQFSPATLEVKAGDTIVWKNKDPFPHTATASDRSFDSGSIASGATWKFKVSKPGTYDYVCMLHPTMRAVLRVK